MPWQTSLILAPSCSHTGRSWVPTIPGSELRYPAPHRTVGICLNRAATLRLANSPLAWQYEESAEESPRYLTVANNLDIEALPIGNIPEAAA